MCVGLSAKVVAVNKDMALVDACHPNDLGFALMANAIEAELRTIFTQSMI